MEEELHSCMRRREENRVGELRWGRRRRPMESGNWRPSSMSSGSRDFLWHLLKQKHGLSGMKHGWVYDVILYIEIIVFKIELY